LELSGVGLALPAQGCKKEEKDQDETSGKTLIKTHFVLLRLLGITSLKKTRARLATLLP
jgi:hypothetical protein